MRRAVEDPFDHEKWGEKLFVRGYWGRGKGTSNIEHPTLNIEVGGI
jgi:hypothetical protein